MENKLINELYRINELMGVDNIIVENVGVSTINTLRKIFTSLSDDVIEKFVVKPGVSAADNELDNIITRFKAGENISQKSLNKLLSQINGVKLAKIFSKSEILMGPDFYKDIKKFKKLLESNPDKYDDVIIRINNTIDNVPYLKDLPDNLKNSLKLELKSTMDAAKDIGVQAKKSAKAAKTANASNTAPIEDDLFNGLLNSVTPSQLDDELKILIKNLGVKFKLNPKNLELFRNELMGRFNILLNKKFPKDYASQLSFVSNELKTLSPSQQKSLLTDVTTNLEKSFGDILNKGKFSTTNKKELMTLLRFGFSRPFQGTIWERIKWIGGWWYHTIMVSGIITVTTTISEVSQHGILGAFQENIVGNKDAVDKFLTKIFLPGYNIIQAGIEAITSIYNAIVSRDDDEKNQSFLEKGESEWFKRKVAKKHPSFKFMNNITVENGQPYLMINDTNYPIYEDVNNAKYFIRVDGEGVYFDNLTN